MPLKLQSPTASINVFRLACALILHFNFHVPLRLNINYNFSVSQCQYLLSQHWMLFLVATGQQKHHGFHLEYLKSCYVPVSFVLYTCQEKGHNWFSWRGDLSPVNAWWMTSLRAAQRYSVCTLIAGNFLEKQTRIMRSNLAQAQLSVVLTNIIKSPFLRAVFAGVIGWRE